MRHDAPNPIPMIVPGGPIVNRNVTVNAEWGEKPAGLHPPRAGSLRADDAEVEARRPPHARSGWLRHPRPARSFPRPHGCFQ